MLGHSWVTAPTAMQGKIGADVPVAEIPLAQKRPLPKHWHNTSMNIPVKGRVAHLLTPLRYLTPILAPMCLSQPGQRTERQGIDACAEMNMR